MVPYDSKDRPPSARHAAWRVALIYALFGVLWILFSDKLSSGWADTPAQLTQIQTFKGWLFIAVTALLVYYLVRSYAAAVQQSNQELRKSEQSYRRMVETANEGICTVDTAGQIQLANGRFSEMVGYVPSELVGEPLLTVVHEKSCHELASRVHNGAGEAARLLDVLLRSKAGQEVWTIAAVSPLSDNDGCCIGSLLMFTDISERKQLESQLLQFQKMEALGQLAGGIAHDFNNIVTAILGNVDLMRLQLKREPVPTDDLATDIDQIERAGERAMALTRQLLTFSRRQVIRREVIEPNRLMADMEKMLNRLIREDIRLRINKGEAAPPVIGDAGQLEQVVINLVVNARDAMPNGGNLSVDTSQLELDESYVTMHPEAQLGLHAVISVSDTGHGMDRQTMERAFEPFFTTKAPGKGTGLGLATVYGIVKQFGGHITVYSEPDMGTTFRVYLPAAVGAATEGVSPEAPTPVPGGSETVFVCEDSEAIRTLLCRVLEERGYNVLSAESPAGALALAERHDGPIHLIIADVIMPGMSGPELAEHLQAGRPETRVIFVSGYTSDVVHHHGLMDAEVEFLPKPFTAEALLRRVRKVLDLAREADPQAQGARDLG